MTIAVPTPPPEPQPQYPPPLAWTETGVMGGYLAEMHVRKIAINYGASHVFRGIEWSVDPHELDVSRRTGARWPDPDCIITLDRDGKVLQFAGQVRGQREDWPDQMAWNFCVQPAELRYALRWEEDHHIPHLFLLVSRTGSIHAATAAQIEEYGVMYPAGFYVVNAMEDGFRALSWVLKTGKLPG